jgi:hypothetical protein
MRLSSVRRTNWSSRCEHVMLAGGRRGKACSKPAYYRSCDQYYCSQHSKRIRPREVEFPSDCLAAIVEHVAEHDKVPLLFVCKEWKSVVKLNPAIHPLDVYLGVGTVIQRGIVVATVHKREDMYPPHFIDWAIDMKIRGSKYIVSCLNDTEYLCRLKQVIANGFPVCNLSFTRFCFRARTSRDNILLKESIIRLLIERGCRYVDI